MYEVNYQSHQVWNYDESGAQARKDRRGLVLARKGSKNVQMVTLDQREWITILFCISAKGESILNFYIFIGKRRTRDFLRQIGEQDVVLAMQAKAWMTNALFQKWMNHFLLIFTESYSLSLQNRHLLILDGHKLHVTLEVIKLAMSQGLDLLLDLLTFPSHTSHAMQPLDAICFKPFKQAFKAYKDK